MKKIISVLLVIISLNVYSQDFAPLGTQWHYTFSNFSVFGYVKITSAKDTVVAGYGCKKLHKYRETYDYMSSEYIYEDLGDEIIRSDEDKVYIYRNGLFYTLFDFSAQIGNIWNVPLTYNVPVDCDTIGSVKVIAVGDTTLQGENLRYIVVEPIENTAWYLSGTIIEDIGPVEQYLFPEQGCIVDFCEGGAFRCFDNGVIHLESGPYPCEYVMVNTTDLDVNYLNCFPNPAKTQITFELPANTDHNILQIKDVFGKTIADISISKGQTQLQWNCSLIPGGVYFYQTEINGELYRGKIVVK